MYLTHETRKKLREYNEWKREAGLGINTPDELIQIIQEEIKSKERQ